MFTHLQLTVDIVWDDLLWRALAWYVEDDQSQPIMVEKTGRIPGAMDMNLAETLVAAARACAADRTEFRPLEI